MKRQSADDLSRIAPGFDIVEAQIEPDHIGAAVMGKPCRKCALASAGRPRDPEQPRFRIVPAPLLQLLQQPLTANEAVHEPADVGLLEDWREAPLKAFDLAGGPHRCRTGKKCEKLIELRAIPCLPSGAALGLASFPVVHVEPLDMAHGHRRPDLAFRFDQDGGDSAALGMQRDRQLVEADARVARGIARQESQGPVRRLQSSTMRRRQSSPDLISEVSIQTS